MAESGVLVAAEGLVVKQVTKQPAYLFGGDSTAFDSSMDYVRSYKSLQGKHVDELLRRNEERRWSFVSSKAME